MNNVNASALLRSLIVYAVCVPLAIIVGWMLTNPLDYQSIGFIGILIAVMVFPLFMRWHYPLLIFCLSFPATLFFLPGHPTAFLVMVAISLTISVVERILDKRNTFLPAGGVQWPLFAFLAVIFITAKLTGGFGLRAMGSEVYGGKKYIYLVAGILSFFALIAKPIPKKQANLYITLFFAGGFFAFISDLYAYTPSFLQYIYLLFPPTLYTLDMSGQAHIELGTTRLAGIASAAGGVVYWMLSRHGIRGSFSIGKPWRPLICLVMCALIFLGGFRSSIIGLLLVLGMLFYLERLHRTGIMLALALAGLLGGALIIPMAPHLPYTFQRALAFLPLNISTQARMDAEGSTEWRLEIWEALLPQVPKYLLLGKGYAFSAETFNESMGANATFQKVIDAADNPFALSSDFHSGPLSLVLPFGIWGVLVWVWFWIAGFFVVWRNYRYGDPALHRINTFLFTLYVTGCFFFVFIFGGVVEDAGHFCSLIGLSIAFNHGICRRPAPAQKQTVGALRQAHGNPAFPPKTPFPALQS